MKVRQRATVPGKRLAQTGSVKADFLTPDTAAQSQNVCKSPQQEIANSLIALLSSSLLCPGQGHRMS